MNCFGNLVNATGEKKTEHQRTPLGIRILLVSVRVRGLVEIRDISNFNLDGMEMRYG
jgi:hypothetical protein